VLAIPACRRASLEIGADCPLMADSRRSAVPFNCLVS
jgi:hypothetical protein